MRYLTSGESHGPQLTAIIEGIPAGLKLEAFHIDELLKARQKGYGRGKRMKIEQDRVQILGGVRHGLTLGSPITLVIANKDNANWGAIMSPEPQPDLEYQQKKSPRAGHADLVGAMKYGHRDLRNVLERSSARETAIRVAVGAVAIQLLKQLGIGVIAHVIQIGKEKSPRTATTIKAMVQPLKDSPVRCLDKKASEAMCQHIDEARKNGDTLGGKIQLIAEGVPAGLGSYVHYDRKLDGKLAAALISVQTVKGISFGNVEASGTHLGSKVHDQITYENGFSRKSNNYGGFEGGMTNGMPLVMEATLKPIPTLYRPLDSVHIDDKTIQKGMIERSDTCVLPAACTVLEAVAATVLATEILEMFRSDTMEGLIRDFAAYGQEVDNF